MASTYSQLDQRVTILNHKSAGSISASDRMALANMALDKLGGDVDLWEARRKALLTPSLYTSVYEYAYPSDVKGDGIIDIRSIGPRNYIYEKKPTRAFDFEVRSGIGLPDFSFENDGANLSIRIKSAEEPQYANIHSCNSLTDNGTWSANTTTSDATNLYANTQNFIEGSGALSLDVDVSQSVNNYAEISNSTMAAVNLTDYLNVGAIFFNVYMPSVTSISSVTLRLGSDASNYYESTQTVRHDGGAFRAGDNLIRVDWSDFSTTGTPVITALDYTLFRITYAAAMTDTGGFLLDHIVARLGKYHELYYYSEHLVLNSSSVRQRSFTTENDTTVFGSEAEILFISLWLHFMGVANREKKIEELPIEYLRALDNYQVKYPSERALLGFEYERVVDRNRPASFPRYQ